jgi:hypothetical protein
MLMNERTPNSPAITAEDIDAWACGQASPAIRAAVEASLDDPNSQASRYCDWLRNPAKYVREHGGSPELVVKQLASLSPETRHALRGINDGLGARPGTPPAAAGGNDYRPVDEDEQGPDRFIRTDRSPGSPDRSR